MKEEICNFFDRQKRVLFANCPKLYKLVDQNKTVIKYVIAGGTAAFVDLSLLFVFTDVLGLHYLVSAVLAFMIAIVVSFNLQKHWTFRDTNKNVAGQMTAYVVTGLMNLSLNTALMYVFVDVLHIMYLLAQVFAGGMIAFGSFLIYRFVIFKKKAVKIT